jgi:hypothetical protein
MSHDSALTPPLPSAAQQTCDAFIRPPELPAQSGPLGIRYDFNDGARVWLPDGQWHVEIRDAEPVLDHTLDLNGQEVLVSFPVGTLGDLVGWIPYAERFRLLHQCQLECTMGPLIIEIFAASYPEIRFTEPEKYTDQQPCASYRMGLSLTAPRTIQELYVSIATKASSQARFWDHIPHGAEDFTGDISLPERVAMLQHADFFIGLSSGLSWLAWACRIPVVLISGFTLPNCEFSTPYRVFSTHVCKGCRDDVRIDLTIKISCGVRATRTQSDSLNAVSLLQADRSPGKSAA